MATGGAGEWRVRVKVRLDCKTCFSKSAREFLKDDVVEKKGAATDEIGR